MEEITNIIKEIKELEDLIHSLEGNKIIDTREKSNDDKYSNDEIGGLLQEFEDKRRDVVRKVKIEKQNKSCMLNEKIENKTIKLKYDIKKMREELEENKNNMREMKKNMDMLAEHLENSNWKTAYETMRNQLKHQRDKNVILNKKIKELELELEILGNINFEKLLVDRIQEGKKEEKETFLEQSQEQPTSDNKENENVTIEEVNNLEETNNQEVSSNGLKSIYTKVKVKSPEELYDINELVIKPVNNEEKRNTIPEPMNNIEEKSNEEVSSNGLVSIYTKPKSNPQKEPKDINNIVIKPVNEEKQNIIEQTNNLEDIEGKNFSSLEKLKMSFIEKIQYRWSRFMASIKRKTSKIGTDKKEHTIETSKEQPKTKREDFMNVINYKTEELPTTRINVLLGSKSASRQIKEKEM